MSASLALTPPQIRPPEVPSSAVDAVSVPTVTPRSINLSERLAAFVELSKPRIAILVGLTVVAAAALRTQGLPELWPLANTLLGATLVAASASAMNQWIERARDGMMARTNRRPLPTGKLSTFDAIAYATATGVAGIVELTATVGWAPAFWAAATWVLYVLVYTPMKTRTWWNTVVGAVAGAAPTWIGWTAFGGDFRDVPALALFGVVFLWQFPHFMAIAWLFRGQYERAGYRMLTVTDASGWWSGAQSVVASALLIPVSLAPAWGVAAPIAIGYTLVAVALGVAQLWLAWRYSVDRSDTSARTLLRGTLLYLTLLMAGLIAAPLLS